MNGARARRDLGLNVGRIERVRLVDVGKDRHAVLQQRADDGATGGPRRHDDLVARVGIDGANADMHRRRP